MRKKPRALPVEVENEIRAEFPMYAQRLDEQANAQAKEALATLFWRGCDPLNLLSELGDYYEIDPDDLRQNPDKADKRILKLSRRLVKDAEEVDQCSAYSGAVANPQLAKLMRAHAKRIKDVVDSSLAPEFERGEKAGLLAALVKMVEMVTRRPHYRELADLSVIFAARNDDEVPLEIDEVTLRMNVHNFKKRNEIPWKSTQDIRTEIYWSRKKWDPFRNKLTKQRS